MGNQDGVMEIEDNINFKNIKLTDTRKQQAANDFLDITALVRSLQRAEGNPDCFDKAIENCDRLDCAWRHYCLEKNPPDETDETKRGKDRDPDQSV